MSPSSIWARGIDVSHHAPVRDFERLKSSDISFIGIKATEGNSLTDPKLVDHMHGARAAGFDLIVYYHFARSGDAVKQAERLLEATGDILPHERLCLDLEVLPSGANVLKWVDDFYERLLRRAPSQRQLIYTSARIWAMFGDPVWDRASYVDLWAPRYNSTGSFNSPVRLEPRLPAPWRLGDRSWKIWQWTDGGNTGPVHETPGVGECDANYFHGDAEDLRTWVKQDARAPQLGLLAHQLVESLSPTQLGHLEVILGETGDVEVLREELKKGPRGQ